MKYLTKSEITIVCIICISLFEKRWRVKTMKLETFSLGYKKNRSLNAFSKLENRFQKCIWKNQCKGKVEEEM